MKILTNHRGEKETPGLFLSLILNLQTGLLLFVADLNDHRSRTTQITEDLIHNNINYFVVVVVVINTGTIPERRHERYNLGRVLPAS